MNILEKKKKTFRKINHVFIMQKKMGQIRKNCIRKTVKILNF